MIPLIRTLERLTFRLKERPGKAENEVSKSIWDMFLVAHNNPTFEQFSGETLLAGYEAIEDTIPNPPERLLLVIDELYDIIGDQPRPRIPGDQIIHLWRAFLNAFHQQVEMARTRQDQDRWHAYTFVWSKGLATLQEVFPSRRQREAMYRAVREGRGEQTGAKPKGHRSPKRRTSEAPTSSRTAPGQPSWPDALHRGADE